MSVLALPPYPSLLFPSLPFPSLLLQKWLPTAHKPWKPALPNTNNTIPPLSSSHNYTNVTGDNCRNRDWMHKRSNSSTTTTTTTATREREGRRRRNEGTARGAELLAWRIKALFTQKSKKPNLMSNGLSIHTSEPKNYNQGVPTRVFFFFLI